MPVGRRAFVCLRAAIGTPIIFDTWPGLETFFEPDKEILIARSSKKVVGYLSDLDGVRRQAIAVAARRRVLARHTPDQRALQLERYLGTTQNQSPAAEPAATMAVA